jgi:hypothetical protein
MVKAKATCTLPSTRGHTRNVMLAQLKALEGITHPSKTLGATPAGCARALPPDNPSLKTNMSQKLPTVTHPQASEGGLHSSIGSGATVGYQNTQGTQRMVKYDTMYNRRSPTIGALVKSTRQKRGQHVSRLRCERQTLSCPSLAERSWARWAPRATSLRLARPPHGVIESV